MVLETGLAPSALAIPASGRSDGGRAGHREEGTCLTPPLSQSVSQTSSIKLFFSPKTQGEA